jgi:hypothetical protein
MPIHNKFSKIITISINQKSLRQIMYLILPTLNIEEQSTQAYELQIIAPRPKQANYIDN